MSWISLRAYARHRKVALSAVQKAIEAGRVTAVRRDEKGRCTGIDAALADQQWQQHTDPAEAAKNGKSTLPPAGAAIDAPAGDELPLSAPEDAGAEQVASGKSDEFGYYEARARREKFQAKQAELDWLKRVGELVSVAAVRDEQFNIFRQLRDGMIVIPDRIAQRLAAETDPQRVHHLLNAEIRTALDECSRALAVDSAAGADERPDVTA